ncbi:Acetyltransferase (GNAT) family protein [Streptomyces sp. CG 926]|nr:Acetyltransferase (GNAT) family protein [Streptomyces sp. CG 926]
MVRDGDETAATITLTRDVEAGLWSGEELAEPSTFVNKLTVARAHGGSNLGGRLLDWAGDRAHRSGASWLRLDAWTTNFALQNYYLRYGFEYVRTVTEGGAVNGVPEFRAGLRNVPRGQQSFTG